jgi:hypothetical protein
MTRRILLILVSCTIVIQIADEADACLRRRRACCAPNCCGSITLYQIHLTYPGKPAKLAAKDTRIGFISTATAELNKDCMHFNKHVNGKCSGIFTVTYTNPPKMYYVCYYYPDGGFAAMDVDIDQKALTKRCQAWRDQTNGTCSGVNRYMPGFSRSEATLMVGDSSVILYQMQLTNSSDFLMANDTRSASMFTLAAASTSLGTDCTNFSGNGNCSGVSTVTYTNPPNMYYACYYYPDGGFAAMDVDTDRDALFDRCTAWQNQQPGVYTYTGPDPYCPATSYCKKRSPMK